MIKPGVTEVNHIPTINRNLTDPEMLLDNAPAAEKSPFETIALRTADRVLSHMGEPYLLYTDTVARLAHEFHMQEMWQKVAKEYEVLRASPPQNLHAFCQCAKDVQNNGVISYLRLLAVFGYRNKNFVKEQKEEILQLGECQSLACKVGRPSVGRELNNKDDWQDSKSQMLLFVDTKMAMDAAHFLICMLGDEM